MSKSFADLEAEVESLKYDLKIAYGLIGAFFDSRETPGLFPTTKEMAEQERAYNMLYLLHRKVNGTTNDG
jgi:hypothetical protein